MKIIGVDPSTIRVGWAVLVAESGDIWRVGSGVFALKGGSREARLFDLMNRLREVVQDYEPVQAAIEEGYVGGAFGKINFKANLALAEARGVAKAVLWPQVSGILGLAPSSIKKMVTGKGNAQKQTVGRAVSCLLKITQPADDNETDALAIAYAAAISLERPLDLSFTRDP